MYRFIMPGKNECMIVCTNALLNNYPCSYHIAAMRITVKYIYDQALSERERERVREREREREREEEGGVDLRPT